MQIGVIDIGGTSIKFGVVNDKGDILQHDAIPTEAERGGKQVMKRVVGICESLMKEFSVRGFSISSAGQIDSVHGKVLYATANIPQFTGTPIAETIRESTGLPVKVENDVNCTALGEYWKGAAASVNHFLCVTIGTGIGGALFLNGELYTGTSFAAGELGHMTLYPNGKRCTCGKRGCYEQYASSAALEKSVFQAFGYALDLRDFFSMVKENDPTCINVFEQWVDDLTTGMASLVHMFNPELIVIGGGISAQGDILLHAIQSSIKSKILPNHRHSLAIKLAEHGNQANLIGAAKHYFMNQ